MNATVSRTGKDRYTLEARGLTLPFALTAACPRCGTQATVRWSTSPGLTLPFIGQPFAVRILCQPCQQSWAESVLIDITIKALNTPPPEEPGQ